jgi:hypothetical protein
VDVLAARPDVDRRRLDYVGIGYSAAMGGLVNHFTGGELLHRLGRPVPSRSDATETHPT